ncbi:MAG: hypothetical protein HFH47_01845 [Bacilli bacterium]|nr:hypothetical protein [Bacilli bacterium]
MLKINPDIDLKELEKFGFKYGTRDKFIYKTKNKGIESRIYIDLLPCHNNNNELKIECESYSIPKKITDVLYDLIQAGLVIKE